MSTTPTRYRLVIFEAIAEPQPVRDLFCRATGMHPTDAMQWLARAPGAWPRPLEESEVRQLLDGLFELGIAAEAWRSDLFPDLAPARTVHRAACLAEGFRIEGLRGEPTHWVPWDRVELICAGRIAAEDEFRNVQAPRWPSTVVSGIRALTLMKPNLPARRGRATRVPRDPVGEVIVVRREPRVAFRIVENQMNYAYLGARLSQSAADNFPVFVADLCARADDAYITPSTRSLLDRGDPAACEFPSSQALLDYATHRLLWNWYRRDREAQQGWNPASETRPDAEPGTSSDGGTGEFEIP
ncbi:MAG: hypothetical protein ACYC61_20255 [Isosphaeraceae bacterium]